MEPFENEGLRQIITALAEATSKIGPIVKDRRVEGRFTYHYADLSDVLAVVRPTLAAHGVVVLQNVTMGDNSVSISTAVWHTSGSSLVFGPLEMPCDRSNAHSIGSAITYGRRYALLAALGLAAEDDDDDAAAAMAVPARKPREKNETAKNETAGPRPVEREVREAAQNVIDTIRAMPSAKKDKIRDWAASIGRRITVSELAKDPELMSSVVEQIELVKGEPDADPLVRTVGELSAADYAKVAEVAEDMGLPSVQEALGTPFGRGIVQAALMSLDGE